MTLPVALLHGFTGSPNSFQAITSALVPAPPFVVAPALVGHRGAGADEHVANFEDEVDRVAALLRARAPSWHLAGYSLGGRVALGLLVRHAGLFASATLIGAQPGLEAAAERDARRAADERWCRLLEERGIATFVDEWERVPLFRTQAELAPAVTAAQRQDRLRHDPRGLARSLRLTGLGAMPPYWNALERISVSTTLLVGSSDEKFFAIAEAMALRWPSASVERVARAGHNVVLEQPEIVARILSRRLGVTS